MLYKLFVSEISSNSLQQNLSFLYRSFRYFYLLSHVTANINDITIFVSRARDFVLIYRVEFSRRFGKIVNRREPRSRPFAAGYYCHGVHNTRATTNPRAGETRVHSSAFTDSRISGTWIRSERGSTMTTIHSPAGVPLMRVPPCGNWPLLL